MKSRWTESQIIASHLGITKFQVYNLLYDQIKQNGLLEKALQGDPETLSTIRTLQGFEKVRPSSVEKCETDAAKLRLAFWFIERYDPLRTLVRV